MAAALQCSNEESGAKARSSHARCEKQLDISAADLSDRHLDVAPALAIGRAHYSN